MRESRIQIVDYLRGIASVGVCFFHLCWLLEPSHLRAVLQYGYLGVAVFFVISGFVIPFSMWKSRYQVSQFGKYIAKRSLRIEPPYLISLLIVVILLYLSSILPFYQGPGFHVKGFNVLLHAVYLVPDKTQWLNPVYWTLAIEFQFYLLAGILFALFTNKKYYIYLLVPSILLILSNLSPFDNKQLITAYFPLFLFGILVFQYYTLGMTWYVFACIYLLSFFVCWVKISAPDAIAGGITGVIILFWSKQHLPNYSVLSFLGKISYSLYLIHVPLGSRVLNFSTRFNLGYIEKGMVVLVSVVVCLWGALIFYKIVELPFLRLSKKLKISSQYI